MKERREIWGDERKEKRREERARKTEEQVRLEGERRAGAGGQPRRLPSALVPTRPRTRRETHA